MKLLSWYKSTMLKFKAAIVKNVFPSAKHTIVYAFTCGGKDYYQFANQDGDLPWQRGMDAIVAYRELSMMCDFDFLKEYTNEIERMMTATKFNMNSAMEVLKWNTRLKERLTFPFQPGLIWNLAAVTFFDKHENPYKFDAEYAYKKIEYWKQNADIEDFFLQMPMLKLIPSLKHYEGNMQIFSQTVKAINEVDWQMILEKKSPEQKQILQRKLSPLFSMVSSRN